MKKAALRFGGRGGLESRQGLKGAGGPCHIQSTRVATSDTWDDHVGGIPQSTSLVGGLRAVRGLRGRTDRQPCPLNDCVNS